MQLVQVTWLDAWQDDENFQTAHGIALTHRPMVVTTLGWLVQQDTVGISVANERSVQEDGEVVYRGRTFVPSGMIRSVDPYRLVKPRKAKQTVHDEGAT